MHAHDNPITLAVVDLINDNQKLAKGVAEQAKTIRELRDELSQLKANYDIQTYNVEFLKTQARRTRLKLRSAKRGRKQAYESVRIAQASVNRATTAIESLVEDRRTLLRNNAQLNAIATNRGLEIASPKAAQVRGITTSSLRGTRANLIIADDLVPRPTSQCNCTVCREDF